MCCVLQWLRTEIGSVQRGGLSECHNPGFLGFSKKTLVVERFIGGLRLFGFVCLLSKRFCCCVLQWLGSTEVGSAEGQSYTL